MEHIFRTTMHLARPRDEVFAFFADAANLERITPPELRFEIVTPQPVAIAEGTRIDYRLRLLGVGFLWQTLISHWAPPDAFVDEQLRGPYRQWIHRHTFRDEAGGTTIEDEVRYALPLFPVGEIGYPFVRLQLTRIFSYRERAIRRLLGG